MSVETEDVIVGVFIIVGMMMTAITAFAMLKDDWYIVGTGFLILAFGGGFVSFRKVFEPNWRDG